ncbi:ComEA family DNA-binding protein [Pseudomonas sp. GOM6]|uniref:ComEA family DNA-binding protein n=1 Tax=Pseudomonas sp. GOM6 TaxID=3036944 RepID=UPI002409E121|nr:ComEA family DNA-binding protein [Pseudomonas sp. GOM6]MDG1581671.1 ComEA family DNA-binding protein [Pseudomonas sp. GOM6]
MAKMHVAALLFSCLTAFSFNATAVESKAPPEPVVEAQQVASQVNLNTADAATLQAELVGIGQVKAQAIVDHRDTNGPFASVDELLEVKGIGPATLEKNRARLSVN